jgi:O-antigen ligase
MSALEYEIGERGKEYYDSPWHSIKEWLIYAYAATSPFFVFSVFFTRDTLALWILGVMIILFIVELISSGGRFWIDSSFIPLALFLLIYLGRTMQIYFEEPGYTWMGKSPLERALAIDLRLSLAIVSFIVTVNYLANAPRRVFILILKIQIVVGIFLIIIALLQYAGYAFYGQSDFLKFEPTNESYYSRGSIFRLGHHKIFRSASIYNEPSFFGFFLVPLLMKVILIWGQKINIFTSFWISSLLIFIILGIYSNFSFTAVFSIVILFVMFTMIVWFGPYRKVSIWIIVFFSIFIIIMSFLPYSNVIVDRFSHIFELRDGSTLDRLFRVYTSSIVFIDHPFFGVGPGGYAYFYPRMGGMDPTSMATPLNIWLNFLTDVGVVGFIPFIIFLVLILKQAFKAAKYEPLVGVYLWSIIAYLVLLTSVDFSFIEILWFDFAILVCLAKRPWNVNVKIRDVLE